MNRPARMDMTTMLDERIRWTVRLARGGGKIGVVEAKSSPEAHDLGYALAVSRGHDPGTILVAPEGGWKLSMEKT